MVKMDLIEGYLFPFLSFKLCLIFLLLEMKHERKTDKPTMKKVNNKAKKITRYPTLSAAGTVRLFSL